MKKFCKFMFFVSAISLLVLIGFGIYRVLDLKFEYWESSDYLLAIFGGATITNLFKVFSE
jgi:hypothetical protein